MQDLSTSRAAGGFSDQKLTDVITRLAAVGFSNIFNEEKKQGGGQPILKVGDRQYKVLDVEERFANQGHGFVEPILEKSLKDLDDAQGFHRSGQNVSKNVDDSAGKKEESKPSNLIGVHPGLTIFLTPINPKEFLDKLPSALRVFVEETVKIIKQKYQDGLTQYRFSFSELKLDILFENGKDGMTIRIVSDDLDSKKSLLNKDNQGLLFSALQQEFPDEKIQLFFDETQSQGSQGFSQQQRDSNSQENQDEAKDED